MKNTILVMLLEQLIKMISPEMVSTMLDAGLDAIEEYIAKSESKIDDATIIPLISMIRTSFNIPDNDVA